MNSFFSVSNIFKWVALHLFKLCSSATGQEALVNQKPFNYPLSIGAYNLWYDIKKIQKRTKLN